LEAVKMNTVLADYNAATESGHLRLNFRVSRDDIAKAQLHPGDWAWLSDGEVLVGARLAVDEKYGLVGIPDWDLVVHLDDEDVHDLAAVQTELEDLLEKPQRSADNEKRIFELLVTYELLAPADLRAEIPSAYFSSLRAQTLFLMGKLEPALAEIEAAR
jgi:hypothetical protein